MKVYCNRRPLEGPWGGGNKTVSAVINALRDSQHEVVHDLVPGIDVLFCFDPRPNNDAGRLADYNEMYQYARMTATQDHKPKIVQRVGDVGTHGKPELTKMVLNTVTSSDTVIFPSAWAYDYVTYSLQIAGRVILPDWHIIQNAPAGLFFRSKRPSDALSKKPRLITHHWSMNARKGFDFYKRLDSDVGSLLNVDFTYIGRSPVKFRNHLGPYDDVQISKELAKHDIYVTASEEEAGANHVLEAMAVGLPVIYHQNGGSISEYCCNYGVPFDGSISSFQNALEHVTGSYDKFRSRLRGFKTKIDDVAIQYVQLMQALHEKGQH